MAFVGAFATVVAVLATRVANALTRVGALLHALEACKHLPQIHRQFDDSFDRFIDRSVMHAMRPIYVGNLSGSPVLSGNQQITPITNSFFLDARPNASATKPNLFGNCGRYLTSRHPRSSVVQAGRICGAINVLDMLTVLRFAAADVWIALSRILAAWV